MRRRVPKESKSRLLSTKSWHKSRKQMNTNQILSLKNGKEDNSIYSQQFAIENQEAENKLFSC